MRLRPKNADQLDTVNADPVVSRKIEIRLTNLMQRNMPNKYSDLMDDILHDVTNYLAAHFLQPEIIQVCKCMKNVFVQCELWCDDILRRMTRPCCKCSRHVSVQQLVDLCPEQPLHLSSSGAHLVASGLQISLTRCPNKIGESSKTCPAPNPTPGCQSKSTASYFMYTSHGPFDSVPTKLSDTDSLRTKIIHRSQFKALSLSPTQSVNLKDTATNPALLESTFFQDCKQMSDVLDYSNTSVDTNSISSEVQPSHTFWQTPTTMCAKVNFQRSNLTNTTQDIDRSRITKRFTQDKNVFSSRTPIITTDQMSDWHSMMVSLLWNVQAWRIWIQENINKILAYQLENEAVETWENYQRTIAMEILQWYQYNIFSRQLIKRLASKYKDKKIVSPTRSTVKTKTFLDCSHEMVEIIDTFNRWTQWFTVTIKETDLILRCKHPSSERWVQLREKITQQIRDWDNYNKQLSFSWENRFKIIIKDWVPGWRQPGPVWVVSACGAVPSGAVAAGMCDGEAIWVARTTHKCKILPAALYPSKHCCELYADGRIYHYTKYQVMCNASVQWVACRAGEKRPRAVRVGDAYVGRVRYRTSHLLGPVLPPRCRCHVIMFRRPIAFDCYELLVMNDEET